MPEQPRTQPPRRPTTTLAMACCACLLLSLCPPSRAQDNPVFLDDSTLAADVLAGLPGLLVSGNPSEAVRLLQRLLDEEGDRLVATVEEPDLLESVRARVNRLLIGNDELLARYRTVETDTAARQLAAGDVDQVERARLLTAPGFEAALRVAAAHLASARFESARLTLAQLDHHPDRDDPARAAQAATLWRQVAAYLDRPDIHDAAQRWAQIAGTDDAPLAPVAWPEALLEPPISPLSSGGTLDLSELVGTPLCSADLRSLSDLVVEDRPITRRTRRIEYPYLFPVVVGDTVYTTDGLWISAWDRFTLSPRWRTKPRGADNEREDLEEQYAAAAYRRNRSRDVEEATTLAVSGRLLIAATGLVANGGRSGDPRLHALDTRTGRVLWSTYIDELDPQLDESSTRGPAVFEGDLAVITVRKISQTKRYASAFLIGIDLADGSARWIRLAASAGWLAYGGRGQWTDWPTIHQGVVYRVDELGVICAVEAGSGRFKWVRKLSGVESRLPGSRLPWAASRPVIDGDSMLALSPDRSELLRLDLETGKILGSRSTQPFGKPAYIFPHGDLLIAVAANENAARVATVPIAQAETAPINVSRLVPNPGIIGRVVAAGDSLLLPLVNGMGAIHITTLEAEWDVALSAPGNLIPLGQQLLTADNERLHSYLVWEDAADVLRARLDADPANASTAITFAELAYRANHPEAVLEPIDRALAAMATDPLSPTLRPGQERLFTLMLEILGTNTTPDPDQGQPRLAPDLLDAIAERMTMVAVTPDERATHLLLRAQLHETSARPGMAVADCQAILADPTLAGASWGQGASSVRAEIDALARLDRLLTDNGPAPYRPFEVAAAESFDQLRAAGASAPEFELLARAYPRAAAAPAAWLAASEQHAETGLSLALDRALNRGLQSATAARNAGLFTDPTVVGELLGRRLTTLLAANRLDTAATLLAQSSSEWPGIDLTNAGTAVDRAALSDSLRARADARSMRAHIGPNLTGTATEIDGWVLMRALDRRDSQTLRAGVMLSSTDRVGLWRFNQETGTLSPAWTAPFTNKPALVRFDPDRVLLFEPDERGGSIIALDPADGRTLWRADQLGETLARARGAGVVTGKERFDAPLDGNVAAGDLLLALDETTIAVVSRAGRAAGIELTSGRVVWTSRTGCQQVNDAAAGDGVLVLGGTAAPDSDDTAGEPMILMLDLASGEETSRFAPAAGPATGRVRWVHLSPGTARVVVGLSRGLVALSIPEAQPDWTLADIAVEQTTGAWSAGSRLFVHSPMREFALVDTTTGSLLQARLDTAGSLELGEPIDAIYADERLVLLSPAGCAMLDATTGTLLGADAIDPLSGGMVQPALASDHLALVEREPVPGQIGLYRLHILDARTGRARSTAALALGNRPRRIAVLDGVILITAGDATIVLPTE